MVIDSYRADPTRATETRQRIQSSVRRSASWDNAKSVGRQVSVRILTLKRNGDTRWSRVFIKSREGLIESNGRALNRPGHEGRMRIEEVVERKSGCIRRGGVTERRRIVDRVTRIGLTIAIVRSRRQRRGHRGRHCSNRWRQRLR